MNVVPVFILIFLWFNTYSQSGRIKYIEGDQAALLLQNSIDTGIADIHRYNPVYFYQTPFSYLGNTGSSYYSVLHRINRSPDFYSGFHHLERYNFSHSDTRYYNTTTPFTELRYITGSQKEQVVNVLHARNIKPTWNIGANFRLINSEGFYQRQKTKHSNLSIFNRFQSKNGRYNIFANALFNGLQQQENGGIENDSLFEENIIDNRKLIGVNLDAAQSNWRGRSYLIKQNYDLGRKVLEEINDSTTVKNFIPTSRIGHSVEYSRRSFRYLDNQPASGFYENIINDSAQTLDSTFISRVINQFEWLLLTDSSGKLQPDIRFFFKNSIIELENDRFVDTLINNLSAGGNVGFRTIGSAVGASFIYFLNGYNQGNYEGSITLRKSLRQNTDSIRVPYIELSGQGVKRSPDFIRNRYVSNHFRWDNNFVPTKLSKGIVRFVSEKHKFQLSAGYNRIENFIYFDTTAFPQQEKNVIDIVTASLEKNFKWRKWGFNNRITYQSASENVIRIPDLYSTHSLYFQDRLIKGALLARIGLEVLYFSEYRAYAYMPATGQFFLQEEKSIGDYPYFDLFVNARIRNATIFAKLSHFNAGLMGFRFYMTPHYPMPGLAVRVGITWRFYD